MNYGAIGVAVGLLFGSGCYVFIKLRGSGIR